jgi:hypothetical protein
VLKRYEVQQVLTTSSQSYLPLFDEWQSLIDENKIRCTLAQAGQQMNIEGVIIDLLNPRTSFFEKRVADTGYNSIVLSVA